MATRTNQSTNPACGANTTGWTVSNGTLSRITGLTGIDRSAAARVTATGANGTVRGPNVSTTGNNTWAASCWARTNGARTIYCAFQWYNNTTFVGQVGFSPTMEANVWRFFSWPMVAVPSGVTAVRLQFQDTNSVSGNTADMTMQLIELTSTGVKSYFDGWTENGAWTGTTNNSTSTLNVFAGEPSRIAG